MSGYRASLLLALAGAFVVISSTSAFTTTTPKQPPTTLSLCRLLMATAKEQADSMDLEDDRRNPDRPELPELKGDFDWDEKFGADDDWITERVPGKIVLNDLELAAQVTALNKLEEQWRKKRAGEEYDGARLLGWTKQAETYNGRLAMFFVVVGLLTEYWTGITFPGQVEEMLRVGGVIGFDG
jgi:hypothetical protein